MKMIKVQGEFVVGIDGVKTFVVQPLTVGAAMDALEDAAVEYGDGVSLMRVRPYEYARMVTVNDVPLTAGQILGLTTQDYDILNRTAGELAKKLNAPTQEKTKAVKTSTPEAS
jgi:hypothetical protein